ncbi:MAG TPA: DEAD/DEAH box helicase family protein [Candidatus Jeotgalibaca pullicola]|nr:DEAD/DEAH box helicase family protein [Candidatus Jeotgalibaca pullicola]
MSYENEIYAVVDLETTGSSYRKGNKIFQIGITMVQNNQIIQDYNFTINPGQAIPPMIKDLTGIKNKDVKNAPYFEDVAPYVHNLLENCIFVAHNIAFDYHFLSESFVAVGLPALNQKGIDTVELTKILFPTLSSYRLSDLSKFFGIEHVNVHDAAGDARATAELFIELKNKAVHLPLVTLEKLASLSPHTQKDNQIFFETCLEIALKNKQALSEEIIILNGIALKKKDMLIEQTAHRMKKNLDVDYFLSPAFLKQIAYKKRMNQQEMMNQIDTFFQQSNSDILTIEAPAGFGKTYAYLIPAILTGNPDKKIVISTSTLLLQEQLQEQINQLRHELPFSFNVTSLKSKVHFIHLERFAEIDLDKLSSIESLVMMSVFVWLTETTTGDLSELSSSHKAGGLLEQIVYQREDGLLSSKWLTEDFLQHYYRNAEQASILITNHAFLTHHFEDIYKLCGEEKPFLIVDEAHRLPTIYQESKKVSFALTSIKRKIQKFLSDVRGYREHLENKATQPFPHYELINLEFSLSQLAASLTVLEDHLSEVIFENEFKKNAKKKNEQKIAIDNDLIVRPGFQRKLKQITRQIDEVILTGVRYNESESSSDQSEFNQRITKFNRTINQTKTKLESFSHTKEFDFYSLIYYYQAVHMFYEIEKSNWNMGAELQKNIQIFFDKTIYISASLLLEDESNYMKRKLGIEGLQTSSCSYNEQQNRQLQIIVPSDIQSVADFDYHEWIHMIATLIITIMMKNQNKVLVLFNSNQALEDVYNKIKETEEYKQDELDVLAQGYTGSRKRVHRRFSEASKVVLLGSGMYWEGIDFPDQAVDVLLMVRLPFDSPDSPENRAISKYYHQVGENSFQQEMLPKMMSRLVQGVGRVSRKENELGLLVCLDTRMLHSSYAHKIKQVLPTGITITELPLHLIEQEVEKFNKNRMD